MHYPSLKAVKIWANWIGNCPRSFGLNWIEHEKSFITAGLIWVQTVSNKVISKTTKVATSKDRVNENYWNNLFDKNAPFRNAVDNSFCDTFLVLGKNRLDILCESSASESYPYMVSQSSDKNWECCWLQIFGGSINVRHFSLIWFVTSQSIIFQLCRNGSSWVEPILIV